MSEREKEKECVGKRQRKGNEGVSVRDIESTRQSKGVKEEKKNEKQKKSMEI